MLRCRLNELDGEEMAELERQVDSECVVQGGRQKPQLTDILAYQLLLLPVKLFQVRLLPLARWPPCNATQHHATESFTWSQVAMMWGPES